MFSYMQITFMVGRFASTPLMKYFSVPLITLIYGTLCSLFSLVAAFTGGQAGLASLFIIFFFESCIYPNVFTSE
jgi:MFS transporter, FHS family, L-fucose permease